MRRPAQNFLMAKTMCLMRLAIVTGITGITGNFCKALEHRPAVN